ncbi:DUF4179 domain-containing protein [Lysinibacillus agricola]|uniref:DUF4179 domain-containing protein n=1 Tax=Lysinibacillus agricola TaxID=2590012 RepID=A0ABX7AVS9_9BACI|nr:MULTISPECIES: DUF4179 domain-containing protein [Lysinibacillus]KOS61663.1 RNA polymerase subunit sigma [Lysinibacillus sp. FJAT-14222]QQP12319.1 DUF4179 domain-containing protein [Lysinibacillus agricola]
MERIEKKLKNQMKASNNVDYPDFDQMWSSIQQDELKVAGGEPVVLRPRKRKRFALVAGLSVALMATPVYAALNYDWSSMLSHREGIQSALEKGLGQTIEQSVTKEGVTLTVHTAFIDENRTVLLYSLKPETPQDVNDVDFEVIGLKDSKGNFIEGNYWGKWNGEIGEFQGYFETDWVGKGQTTDVEFIMENMRLINNKKQSISYNPNDSTTQVFPIQKDGLGSVTLQSFEQAEGKVLLKSAVTLTDPELENRWINFEAINSADKSVKKAESSSFVDMGANMSQIFKSNTLREEGTKFQLSYDHILETKESTWSINMNLSKKQLENGSFKQVLDIPMDNVPGGTKIHEMKVTPTQVRLKITQEDYYTLPFREYQLDVGGTLLNGYFMGKGQEELRFEVVGLDAASLANQPITLVAKHRIDSFYGDENDKPIHLTDISEKHQTTTSSIAGYPVSWTYYLKDNNLYVETLSSDPTFDGVDRTYYLDGKEQILGEPESYDESNKSMDVYEKFDKKELDIYIYSYGINKPNEELRIPLKSGK